MSDKRALEEEYNAHYRRNPQRWADEGRDSFAFDTVSAYLKTAPASMLDIGCGSGHTIAYFQERWPETHYTGLDLSAEAISLAMQRVPGASFMRSWLGYLGLPRFELVTLLGVAEHFENLQNGLRAARRTMTDSGIMYIEVPNCIGYPSSEKVEGFRRLNMGSGQQEWHLHRETWEQELRQAGFVILESIQGPSIFTEFVWLLGNAQRPVETATIRPSEKAVTL